MHVPEIVALVSLTDAHEFAARVGEVTLNAA